VALKEAKWSLLIVGILTLLGTWLWWPLFFIGILTLGLILGFFRDPGRTAPQEADIAVAAADGKVVCVDEPEELVFTNKPMKRIGVFLSVLDVHVNRSPVAGQVVDIHHHGGEFLDARHPDVGLKNEAMVWLLQTEYGNVVVRQIAGLIARRIVAWRSPGDILKRGERFGMIKFGSRTDVYLPVTAEVLVQPGDRVKGGETLLARLQPAGRAESGSHPPS